MPALIIFLPSVMFKVFSSYNVTFINKKNSNLFFTTIQNKKYTESYRKIMSALQMCIFLFLPLASSKLMSQG